MKFLNLLIVLFLFYKLGGSSSSSCGELHKITYPYTHSDADCHFELQCDDNNTVLYNSPGNKYLVKDISIENKTLRLVDPYMAVGSCHLPKQADSEFDPFYCWDNSRENSFGTDQSLNLSSIYFFNCTEEVENSMYKQIHCMDGPHSRVYAAYGYHGAGSTPKSCSFQGRISADILIENHWKDIDDVHLMKMLRHGFVVDWTIEPSNFVKFCWNEMKSDLNGIMSRPSSNDRPFVDEILSNTNTGNRLLELLSFNPTFNTSHGLYLILSFYPNFNTGYRLLELLSVQPTFLYCIQQEAATNLPVVYWFMLILLTLLDILLVLFGIIRLTLLPLIIFAFVLHKYKRVSLSINFVEKFLRKHEILSVRRYDFMEIALMTNNFREKIGQGGFGSVYKGKLLGGYQVAVKILTNSSGNGDDFISEVATIGRIHHRNIVRLIGFCSEGSKRALVYPFLQKGSLDKFIFGSNYNSFPIEKRRQIALGIAQGIDYLHRGCQMQILHFDIKPHNILLDHDLTPKISDFGLAKLYSREHSLVTLSMTRGTPGYTAPELVSRAFGVISHKVDVYSFGMVLMEMASGRRNVNNHTGSSSQVYYPSWIYDQLKLAEGVHNSNLHNSIVQFGEIEGILYKVALWCIQSRVSNRPSMNRVVEMLQSDADSLEMPPKPFTTCSPNDVSMTCSKIDSCSIELSEISEEISLL